MVIHVSWDTTVFFPYSDSFGSIRKHDFSGLSVPLLLYCKNIMLILYAVCLAELPCILGPPEFSAYRASPTQSVNGKEDTCIALFH